MLESWNVGKTKGKSQGGVISIELIGSMEFGGAAHRNIQEGWKYEIDQLIYFLLS